MRTTTHLLCTTSIFALLVLLGAVSALGAFAQTQSTGQATPNQTAVPDGAASAAPAGESTEIVVRGLRRSIASARAIRRNSDQIVDAVVAEDIGKLPDVTASDSLARIAGVQVARGGGEANQVLVRGLPNIATSYNGRDIFTAEARYVAVQDFPAGGVAALEVYKSTTADQVEGGIAGLINVRSRRPFDFKGREISGELRYTYASQSRNWDPNGNLMITDRWMTPHGEMGALLNVSYTRLRYLDSARWVGGYIATNANGQRYGDFVGEFIGQGDRQRPSVNAAFQWRPNDAVELYSDFLYQGFDNKVSDRQLAVPLWIDNPGTTYSNVVLEPGTSQIASQTVTNARRPEMFQGASHNRTDTYQFAVGGRWTSGPWRVSSDLATTQSTYNSSIYSLDTAMASSPVVNVTYDVPKDPGGVSFSFENFDPTDPTNVIYRGFFDRHLRARGNDVQFRADAEYRFAEGGILSRLQFGYRYVDRKGHFDDGSQYNNQEGARIPISNIGLDIGPTQAGFRGSGAEPVVSWAGPTYESIRENIGNLRTLSGFPQSGPAFDPLVHFDADEKSNAIYGQIHYALGTSLPIDGVLGVRAVKTEETISGFQRSGGANGVPTTFTPRTQTNDYTDVLPTATLQVRFNNELRLRLAANRTRTRPDFAQLNPSLAIDPQSHVEGGVSVYGASGGNIDLTPYTSDNYDITLEDFFSTTGYATIGIFRRDVSGFIQYHTVDITDPTLGTVRATQPYNATDVRLQGAEAQFTTFFDFASIPDWARNFGVQVNGTYIEGGSAVVGVSRWAYNLVGMYEKGPFSARIAFNYRSRWLNLDESTNGGNPGREYTKPVSRLDLSANWNVTDRVTLNADISNALGEPYRSYRLYTNGAGGYMPRDVRYEETLYSLAVRFRL